MEIAVVDDNERDRKQLISYIKKISYELNCEVSISAYSMGEDFLEDREMAAFDAVFLDIFMGMKNGIEIARILRDEGYQGIIIFCTTSTHFALDGYSVKAMNYIVKPFSYEKIVEQLKDIIETLGENTRSIRIKDGRQWHKVNLVDILYVEKHGNYVHVHAFGKTYCMRVALGEMEEQLFRYECFAKCDRGIIVNLKNIADMQGNVILLKDNSQVPISRSQKAIVNERYFDYIFKNME